MLRTIDHLVIPAHDLAAQAAAYVSFGFQVGQRNRHPWGTENHIVQFDGAFLELIGLGADFARLPAQSGIFSFAGFVADYLTKRQGLAMLVLASSNAEADRAAYASRGLGDFERFDFARKARKPDGREVEVAFSLAFAAGAAFPETGFFVCQQHFPENFWNRSAQVHPNGATGIVGLAFAHESPAEAADFLSGFLEAPAKSDRDGLVFELRGASVTVASPDSLAQRFGVDHERMQSPGLAAVEVAVADLAATATLLTANGVEFQHRGNRLVVDENTAIGAILAFVQAPGRRPPA